MIVDPVHIRTIQREDLETITQIYLETLSVEYVSFSELGEGKALTPNKLSSKAGKIFRDDIRRLLNEPHHHFLMAKQGGKSLGFALASIRESRQGIRECWLDDICVRKLDRARGVATELWNAIRVWGMQQGAAHFFLESGVHNTGAHEFFHKKGFEPLATVFWLSGKEESD